MFDRAEFIGSETSRLPLYEQHVLRSVKKKDHIRPQLTHRYPTSAKKPAQLVAMEQVRHTGPVIYTAPSTVVLRMYAKQYTISHSSHKGIKGKNSLVMEMHSFLLFMDGLRL